MTGPFLANAPVSFGVWGPHTGPVGIDGAQVLAAVATAGYQGCDLGPPGYLGDADECAKAFAANGLRPAGIYVGLHLQDPAGLGAQGRNLLSGTCRSVIRVQQAVQASGVAQAPPSPVVLADEGSPALRQQPARDPRDRSLALSPQAWRTAAATIEQARSLIADHGLPTSFHPHLATHVESAWEVDRLLETTRVGITLDTGHLLLAGADPVHCLRHWGDRVDHVHLKDVRLEVLRAARRSGAERIDDWWGRVCVPFGAGDVDLAGVVAALVDRQYRGWIVVEEDREPSSGDDLPTLTERQRANRDWLLTALQQHRW